MTTIVPTKIPDRDCWPFFEMPKAGTDPATWVHSYVDDRAMRITYKIVGGELGAPLMRQATTYDSLSQAQSAAAGRAFATIVAQVPLMPPIPRTDAFVKAAEMLTDHISDQVRDAYAVCYLQAVEDAKRQGWYQTRAEANETDGGAGTEFADHPSDQCEDCLVPRAHYYLRELIMVSI